MQPAERPAGLEQSSAWSLVSGIFLFPFSPYAWARWLALSLGLALVLGLLAEAVALGSGALSQFSALGAAAWAAYRVGGAHALVPIAPLAVAAIWIDARLLGRLARYLTARDQPAAVAEKGQIQDDS